MVGDKMSSVWHKLHGSSDGAFLIEKMIEEEIMPVVMELEKKARWRSDESTLVALGEIEDTLNNIDERLEREYIRKYIPESHPEHYTPPRRW